MIFGKKKYLHFSRIISKEIIITSLVIIKAILNPFSATFSAQGIFQHHFQSKKVRTILDKKWYM
jgi:hypothetical protein